MKKIKFLLNLTMLTLVIACNNHNPDTIKPDKNNEGNLSIINITPNNGSKNTEVIIEGTGFNKNTIVTFNGKQAEVLDFTATSLTVKSPKGAGTGKIEVKQDMETVAGPIFYYRWTATVSTFSNADFVTPEDMSIDAQGNLYVTDGATGKIYKITPQGEVLQIAELLNTNIAGIAVNSQGQVYVTNDLKHVIYKIVNGQKILLAGKEGSNGYQDGQGVAALFSGPNKMGIDSQDNLYIMDKNNGKIRKVTPTGLVSTIVDIPNIENEDCFVDGDGVIWTANHSKVFKYINNSLQAIAGGDNTGYKDGLANEALFNQMTTIIPMNGDVFICDYLNNRLRYLSQDGYIFTLAGNGNKSDVDGVGIDAQFLYLKSMVKDNNGILWVLSFDKIRKVVLD